MPRREVPRQRLDEQLFRPLLAALYALSPETLASRFGINEGLEHRILKAAKTASSLHELRETLRSRRYPMSRISRTLLTLLLHFNTRELARFDATGPLYLRVLAFSERGRSIQKDLRKKSTLPIVTRVHPFLRYTADKANPLARHMLQYDILASDLWGLTLDSLPPAGEDFRRSPIFISR